MECPKCFSSKTKVLDSRRNMQYVKRIRKCESCSTKFNTWEISVSDAKDVLIRKLSALINEEGIAKIIKSFINKTMKEKLKDEDFMGGVS